MPEKIVKQHYIALVKLLKNYSTSPLDRNLLKATLHFCKSLYGAANAHPDLIFAQTQLYKTQLPFIVNLSFNSVVLTCLLGVRNKFDPSVTIQLMCGSLSNCALEQSALEKHYQSSGENLKPQVKIGQKKPPFVQLLKRNQQQIWLSTYLLCTHTHINQYPRNRLTTPITALAYMANKLALLCTPNKQKQPLSFANAIKHLTLTSCSKWYSLLTPLLDYPSVSPLGSYIRLHDGSIHIVLALCNNGLVTKPLPIKKTASKQSDKVDIQYTNTAQIKQSYPSQLLNNFSRLSKWWGSELLEWFSNNIEHEQKVAFELILPFQTAPASLMVIQDQLNHNNADIAIIVKAIEKEPVHAHHLQVAASISNRNKQPVQTIQHALAMLGFERTNSILLQHSLISRLNQQYFPLQQKLLAFSQFFVFIAGELATLTKLVSPELARTTAFFVVSRLFTLPTIRTLNNWGKPTDPTFKLASLIKLKESKSLKNDGFLLAKSWLQNKQTLEVLQNYDLVIPKEVKKNASNQYCYLIGLSLILAQEYYFTGTTRCNETADYFNSGLIELGFTQAGVIKLMSDITSSTNVFCPLEYT
jgi:hypothetical protein